MTRPNAVMPGERFGRLTVISALKATAIMCRCACGNKRVTKAIYLRSGRLKSCGCMKANPYQKFDKAAVEYQAPKPLSRNARRRAALVIIKIYLAFLNDPLRLAMMSDPADVEYEIKASIKRLIRDYGPFTKDEINEGE